MKTVMRVMLVFGLVIGLVAVPAGAAAEAPGTHERTLTMPGGWAREYLLHVPPGRTKARPLVVALHGGLNDMHYIREQTGLDEVSDKNGFLVAYPNGFMRTWNAGGCCWFARMAGIDDVGFLDALIDKLVRDGLADPRRIYLTGFSNGGGMAYRYACERAGRVAAIGVVSGSLATECEPRDAVSVMAFHGTADFSVPFGGGGNLDWNNENPFPSVISVMNFWRDLYRLSPLRRITLDTAKTTCRTTGRGPSGTEVEFCTIFDGGHEWPRGADVGVDPEVEASPMLWRFFNAHVRRG
ncbi:alpha/beta hydrolase family esterase [Actinomadura sp. 9N407]|uniref:alpha/beta hydrolase family esterase n=1 Tax=Actinomadura sp. 9N407 TaxID=3375154 RepID=UPI0037950BBF